MNRNIKIGAILAGLVTIVILAVLFFSPHNTQTSSGYEILEEKLVVEDERNKYYTIAILIPQVSEDDYNQVVEAAHAEVLKEVCEGRCDMIFFDDRRAFELYEESMDMNSELLREHTIAITNEDVIGFYYYPYRTSD